VAPPDHDSGGGSRADRLSLERGSQRRRTFLIVLVVVVVVASGAAAYAVVSKNESSTATAAGTSPGATTTARPTTTLQSTTTTTIPAVKQPPAVTLPTPGHAIGYGSRGPVVMQYEARLKALHFDPGPVDGVFGQDTEYAVVALEKFAGLTRDGSIGPNVQHALEHFRYTPAEPKTEGDRVEIDLDRQVLTVYQNWQPILLTTASTGSGERFCGGVDGCQYAITPAGHFHFYDFHKGWQKGKLGTMWNPYYFNGSIAVHGLQSVPAYPASHGCTRIPMHIADYFYTLVHMNESVFVVGTPMKVGNGYVGPTTTVSTTTTVPPRAHKPTKPAAHTTTTTVKTQKVTTTTHPKTTTTTH
jgi:peptidoglycan hydrolase-like protein with peptidoglycan-binding domain